MPKNFDLEQFRVICYECAAYVNDRPLAPPQYDKEGQSSVVHVSPSQLVKGRSNQVLPTTMRLKDAIDPDERVNVALVHRHRAKVLNLFWREFVSSYQRLLRIPKKWHEIMSKDIPQNTMVLIKLKTFKGGQFLPARVLEAYRRKSDGVINKLLLQTADNKNPIVRDLRSCYLTEHEFLKLQDPDHHCHINGNISEN